MSIESFRKIDMRAEQVLGEFMDEFFYSKLKSKDGNPIRFKRMTDYSSQMDGIDVCIEMDDREIIIDEKASIYFSNAMIPTFAFELDSIQEGHENPVEGWFVNDDLKTEYYMLIWPNVNCKEIDGKWIRKPLSKITKYDFTIVEAMMIKKKDIRALLEDKGYDRPHLLEYAKRIRNMNSGIETRYDEDLNDGLKLTFSGQLAEKPINLVINKSILWYVAQRVYLISADGYASIKV